MRFTISFMTGMTGLLVATAAWAGTMDDIAKDFAKKTGSQVDKVSTTQIPGLYEVYADGDIFYTDAKTSVMVRGDIINLETHRDITSERLQALSRTPLSSLNLDWAIKEVRGNGKRVLAVFEDPYCPSCKRLEPELAKLKDVTIYTFLYPVLGMESHLMAHQLWCAPDQLSAWRKWMSDRVEPPEIRQGCDISPVEKTLELGTRLKFIGTPTLIFADGSRTAAVMRAAEIERRMDAR